MPKPGHAWWHLTLSTRGSWLHGDARGFRSRGHRIHSSGDYKNRPPKGEHARLHRYQRDHSEPAIVIPRGIRDRIGRALLKKLDALDAPVMAVAVSGMHAHAVVEWTDDYQTAKELAGKLKQASSHAVRDAMPGRIWADGGKPVRVRDREHQKELRRYLLDHAKRGAWTWCYRDAE